MTVKSRAVRNLRVGVDIEVMHGSAATKTTLGDCSAAAAQICIDMSLYLTI